MTSSKKMQLLNVQSRIVAQQVRDKRYSTSIAPTVSLAIEGQSCKVQNISDSGASFWSMHEFPDNLECSFDFKISDHLPVKLSGRIIWKRPMDDGFLYGFHFNNKYLPEGFLEAIDRIELLSEKLKTEGEHFELIDVNFKLLTYEIKFYLETTKQALDALEVEIQILSEGVRNSYREVIKSQIEPKFVHTVKEFSKRLDALFSKIQDRKLRKAYISFFRKEVGDYYTQNPFIGRALRKPRGYAGDYEMMNQIYRNGYEGNSFFEMLMHRYGIRESSSLSVMYRKGYFVDKMKAASKNNPEFTVASIASGPAQEVIQFLDEVDPKESENYNIVLVDQDVEALLNSKRNIYEKIISRDLKCQTYFFPITIKHIIEGTEEAQVLREFEFDMIYTAGLYDYVSQSAAQILTQQLSMMMKSEGLLIIGNFHPNNPTKTISELVSDWRLIHRTEEDMIQLLNFVSHKSYNLHKDDQEIDLFLEVIIK